MGLPGVGWLGERPFLHYSHGSVWVCCSSSFGSMACGSVWGGIFLVLCHKLFVHLVDGDTMGTTLRHQHRRRLLRDSFSSKNFVQGSP